MITDLAPADLSELVEAVRSKPRLIAVGAGTKPRLSAVDAPRLSTTRLAGMVEYDPAEFTFTALSGTPLREIASALAEQGQYLPFDPLFVSAGSTLGGAVASGLSGPGRFRYGGVRDFILGVRFVDGAGRLLRMGGKVVKNAAGFDLPKFFTGSIGRFGVLAELTLKVFPRPASTLTLRLTLDSVEDAARVLIAAANTRWEADALDLLPDGRSVLLRLAGPELALAEIAREVLARWPGDVLDAAQAAELWDDVREMRWAAADAALIKAPITAARAAELHHELHGAASDARIHISAGGDVAYISTTKSAAVDAALRRLGLRGMTLRGDGPLWCGAHAAPPEISRRIKHALDAERRFPDLEE